MSSAESSWHEMVEGRLNHHSEQLVKLVEDQVAIKQRLSTVEQDRESIREMVAMVTKLADKTDRAIDAVDEIAERAVTKVLKVRAEDRKLRWKHNAVLTGGAFGMLGAGLGFANQVFHLIHL